MHMSSTVYSMHLLCVRCTRRLHLCTLCSFVYIKIKTSILYLLIHYTLDFRWNKHKRCDSILCTDTQLIFWLCKYQKLWYHNLQVIDRPHKTNWRLVQHRMLVDNKKKQANVQYCIYYLNDAQCNNTATQ